MADKKMTVIEAMKFGLKCGNKILVEFEVTQLPINGYSFIVWNKALGYEHLTLDTADEIIFNVSDKPYTPAHNELCTILTKNGLGTKAIAVHYNGKISAISIDNEGNADCHFKAEQIEKFLPLPPA